MFRQKCGRLTRRLHDETDSEYGLFGLVQKLHMPFGVLLETARDAAEEIAANLGHLGPRRFAALELGALFGSAGIATMADAEEIQRHL